MFRAADPEDVMRPVTDALRYLPFTTTTTGEVTPR